MRNIIAILCLSMPNAHDVSKEIIELRPLFQELESSSESDSDQGYESPPYFDSAPSVGESKFDDISMDDQALITAAIADLRVIERHGILSETEELIEEIIRLRRCVNLHADAFNKAIESRRPFQEFSAAFTEISTLSGLKELCHFYAQLYYDEQITKLYDRLDRGRTTLFKSLAANNYRTSATQEAINSLNVYASLMGLNPHSNSGSLGKIMQFFSQAKPAEAYFSELFSNIKDKDEQYELMDIALNYLVERYRADRSWLNKWLAYLGLKTSYTREAIMTLATIAKLLDINVRHDYQRLLEKKDNEMLGDSIEYLLTW